MDQKNKLYIAITILGTIMFCLFIITYIEFRKINETVTEPIKEINAKLEEQEKVQEFIIEDLKDIHLTQAELAKRVGEKKTYSEDDKVSYEKRYSKNLGIDYKFLISIQEVENPNKDDNLIRNNYNKKGEVTSWDIGRYQINSEVAEYFEEKYGLDAYNPRDNILIACIMVAERIKVFDGDLLKAAHSFRRGINGTKEDYANGIYDKYSHVIMTKYRRKK